MAADRGHGVGAGVSLSSVVAGREYKERAIATALMRVR
jgi:hypothetical protein